MIEIKKKHVKKVETKYIINSASWTVSFWCWPYEQVVLKNMEVENKTIPGPKWRPILLLKSMEAENIFLTLCQVRCIPWVQMGTFNKEIGFLCGLKFFALNIFCVEYLQSSLHLMLQIWWKPLLWQMCQ